MRALVASPLGFLIGLSLGALGGGGSILAVPALVYAAGQDPKEATASSLMLVGSAALVGIVPHWRAGRVRVAMGLTFGVVGIGGSILGSAANRLIDPDVLLLGFSGLTLVAAWRMLRACPTCTQVGERRETESADATGEVAESAGLPVGAGASRTQTSTSRPGSFVDPGVALAVVAAGTAVGFLTGLFGVGGGFVIVPALTLTLKLTMPEAIGTSLLVIAVNSFVALTARVASAGIDWQVTLPFTVAAIGGVVAGERVASVLEPERSLRAFAALLVGVAIYTAVGAALSLT